MRGCVTPLSLTREKPLDVYVHEGPDSVTGLYSRDNRRLAVLLMYQACRRKQEQLCEVWCVVRGKDDPTFTWPELSHYSGTDGLSIAPRLGDRAVAKHRGSEMFVFGHAAVEGLKRARRFLKSETPLRPAVDMVLKRVRLRSSSVAQSETSIKFSSSRVHLRSRSPRRNRAH